MSKTVRLGLEYFPHATTNRCVANGYIYVGIVDTDPEISANQQTVTALQEDGTTVAISQPIRTSQGGVPVYNGSPVTLGVDLSYSLKILDSNGTQVYYIPKSEVETDNAVYYVNPDEQDQGIEGGGETIYAFCQDIGTSKKATIYLRHTGVANQTEYNFSTTFDATNYGNITLYFENGAVITDDSNDPNITLGMQIDAKPEQQIFDWLNGTGSISLTNCQNVYLAWFGPNADGTTDDAAIIQLAVNSVMVGGNLNVNYTDSGYKIESSITGSQGVSIINNVGYVKWIFTDNTGLSGDIIYNMLAIDNTTVRGIHFYTSGTKASLITGIDITSTGINNTIEYCKFENLTNGIKISGISSYNNRILHCSFDDVSYGAGGAIFTDGDKTLIDGCEFTDIASDKFGHCCYAGPNHFRTKMINCSAKDIQGYMLSNGSSDRESVATLMNSTCEDCYGCASGLVICSGVHVINQDDASGAAFYLGYGGQVVGCSVRGFKGKAFAIDQYCVVSGNRFEATTTNAPSTGAAMEVKGTSSVGSIIESNTFIGSSVTPVDYFIAATTAGKYLEMKNNKFYNVCSGTVLTFTSDYVKIRNNTFHSSNAASYHDGCVVASGDSNTIINNEAVYETGTPTSLWDISAMTESATRRSFLEMNLYNGSVDNIPAIASATDILVNSNTYCADITGTTDIATISGTCRKAGRTITLKFNGSLTLKHNTAGSYYKLLLNGAADVTVTANDLITLMFNGSVWYQATPLLVI